MASMIRMAIARNRSRLLQLAVLSLAAAYAGCGKVACFEWTQIEGSCPAQSEALAYFTGPNCSGDIESIDSEPERSGDYCCYDVTKKDDTYYYDGVCTQPAGGGAVAPSPAPAPSR
jgi:hypothetical protein